jgi:hypothetical protein
MNYERSMMPTFRYAAALPVYHWFGPRPELLDLAPDRRGWLICLSLQRDGDLCLLPLAWDQLQHSQDDPRPRLTPLPPATPHTQAFHRQQVEQIVQQLVQDGWQVNGRLTLHFSGAESEPHFDQITHQYLWQLPEKDEL